MNAQVSAARTGPIVAILALTGIVASLTQTLVIPLVAELPTIFGTSASNTSWVVTVTLLAAAVAVPIAGRLGDMHGKRRIMLLALVPLILGSVVCALAPNVWVMVVGRALQGFAMGVVPLGISLLRDILPPQKLGGAIALLSASMGVGGALGLPIAAGIAQNSSWRVLFWVVAALAAMITVLIATRVPADEPARDHVRFDFLGAIGLGGALVALLLAVSKGADWGWGSGTTLGLIFVAVVLLGTWGWWELRHDEPLVDLRTTARPQVLVTNVASVLVGFSMYALSLVAPQILQLPAATGYGLGQSMLQMGLWMAPGGLMMMAASPVGARISAARGPKITLGIGALVIAVGYGLTLPLMGSAWGLMVAAMVANSGVGFAYGAMPALIMGGVPRNETASANSFNTLMRSIGTSLAGAVMGVLLAHMTTDFAGIALPSETGLRTALAIGAGVALVAAVVAFLIPVKRSLPTEIETDAPVPDAEKELAPTSA